MLLKTSYRDVPTKANGKDGTMRIYVIEPNLPDYPEAKFPGCKWYGWSMFSTACNLRV